MYVGLPIGHDDHLVAPKLRVQQPTKALGRPASFLHLTTADFVSQVPQPRAHIRGERFEATACVIGRSKKSFSSKDGTHPRQPAAPAQLRHDHGNEGDRRLALISSALMHVSVLGKLAARRKRAQKGELESDRLHRSPMAEKIRRRTRPTFLPALPWSW